MTETPADEYRQAAAELRDVAPMIDGPLAGLADPVADWLDQAAKHHDATVIGAASVWRRDHEAEERDAWVAKQTDHAALAVARRVLGTTTGQPATAPWPPAGVERPDHKLYTLLRRTGLTPEAAQQEIDTYTQTIRTQPAPAVNRAAVLNERADFFEGVLRNAADPEGDPRYWSAISDVARGLRQVAAEAQQPAPAEAHAAETEWVVETLWRSGEWRRHWAPRATRDEAEQDYERSLGHDADHEYRIVRVTTTTTVEPAPAVTEEPTPCGNTQGLGTRNPYRPCARPAGHPEAYCKDATGDHLFLPATHATEEPK